MVCLWVDGVSMDGVCVWRRMCVCGGGWCVDEDGAYGWMVCVEVDCMCVWVDGLSLGGWGECIGRWCMCDEVCVWRWMVRMGGWFVWRWMVCVELDGVYGYMV